MHILAAGLIAMTAIKGFTNPRVTGPRPDGSIVAGDTFTTDWDHARDLVRLGIAEADSPDDLKHEPTEPLQPHNQISVTELHATNERRGKARGGQAGAAAAQTGGPAAPVAGAVTEAGLAPATLASGPAAPAVQQPAVKTNAPAIPAAPVKTV